MAKASDIRSAGIFLNMMAGAHRGPVSSSRGSAKVRLTDTIALTHTPPGGPITPPNCLSVCAMIAATAPSKPEDSAPLSRHADTWRSCTQTRDLPRTHWVAPEPTVGRLGRTRTIRAARRVIPPHHHASARQARGADGHSRRLTPRPGTLADLSSRHFGAGILSDTRPKRPLPLAKAEDAWRKWAN